MAQHCHDLRSEGDAARHPREIQRLDADAITCQDETPAIGIPERKREHPVQVLQEVEAVLLVEMDDGFGV